MSLVTRTLTIGSLGSAIVAGSFLHPLVTGQVMHTTARGDPIGLGLLPSAAAFVALALVLGLAAFCRHSINLERLTPSSSAGRRVATIAVVGLVISTAAIGGLGGPASPVETVQAGYFEDCTFSDSLTFAVGASLGLSNQDCTFWTPDSDVENISKTDAYASGLALQDSSESFTTTSSNFNEDRASVAWAKAKISLVNDLNNNVSEANATANAKEVVREYYSNAAKNVITDYSAKASHTAYIAGQLDENDDGAAVAHQGENMKAGTDTNSDDRGWADSTAQLNVTFSDNTSATYEIPVKVETDGDYHPVTPYNSYGGLVDFGEVTMENQTTLFTENMSTGSSSGSNTVTIFDGNQDPASETMILEAHKYANELDALDTQSSQVTSNIDQYATDVYAAYNAGEINATDLANADPQVIGTQAATDYNSTGYYGMANAQLSALGLSGNETISHVVNTTDNGSSRTIEGTLYYTGEDSQTFDSGTEYDPANLNGSVYMTVASLEDGSGNAVNHSGGFYYVDENFTISSATNTKTGEAVNTTTMETRDYSSTNASLLAEEIDRLQEQRAYYEEQQAASSGGISLDFGGVETGVILALLAVAFLATRD